MSEEKLWPNEIGAHIITRNTKADSNIRFFENRVMKIIWLSIYMAIPVTNSTFLEN